MDVLPFLQELIEQIGQRRNTPCPMRRTTYVAPDPDHTSIAPALS
jgi:hypothetical protein